MAVTAPRQAGRMAVIGTSASKCSAPQTPTLHSLGSHLTDSDHGAEGTNSRDSSKLAGEEEGYCGFVACTSTKAPELSVAFTSAVESASKRKELFSMQIKKVSRSPAIKLSGWQGLLDGRQKPLGAIRIAADAPQLAAAKPVIVIGCQKQRAAPRPTCHARGGEVLWSEKVGQPAARRNERL